MVRTRQLYVFPMSPFSRRARLALTHKGLDAEIKDARANPALRDEAATKTAFKTIPILLDGDVALGDSGAIANYLERAYPEGARLFPDDDAAAAFDVIALVDYSLATLIDLGTRFFDLRDAPAWPKVKGEQLDRAARALDALGKHAERLGGRTVARSGWSAADMWLFTMTAWLEGLPARAANQQNIAQLVSLGWSLPTTLSRWADAHRGRADVRALDT